MWRKIGDNQNTVESARKLLFKIFVEENLSRLPLFFFFSLFPLSSCRKGKGTRACKEKKKGKEERKTSETQINWKPEENGAEISLEKMENYWYEI